MLTSINGDEWKDVRTTFSPIFTSGKMKGMLKYIIHVSNGLVQELETKAKLKEEFELKDVFGKFSLDALASAAFGVDGESFTNKDSLFVKYAARIFEATKLDMTIFSLRMIPGKSISALKVKLKCPIFRCSRVPEASENQHE